MILLCGIPSEPPLARVHEELRALGAPVRLFNQRAFATSAIEFTVSEGGVDGYLLLDGASWPLREVRAVYTRLMDDRQLPEVRDEPENSPRRRYCRALHEALTRWCELAPGRVVNRVAPMASNGSKPYQAQLIARLGFRVPETLITTDPERVRAFQERHDRVIYKSISGVRSIVRTLDDDDLARLESIRWCPTQFQEFVDGVNVRVHVIGRELHATRARTTAVDYRYAARQVGDGAELEPVELSDELAERCVQLAAELGLAFAGIDLKVTPDDRVYCFEVNPSPAYSYYEANTGQPIARSVARYLMELAP